MVKYPVLRYPVALVVLLIFMLSGSFLVAHAQNQSVATLRILTHVINDDGGTNRSSDFTNCIDSSTGSSSTTQCSSGDSVHSFDAGSYDVTQDKNNPVRGYTVTYSKDCSGVINAGDTRTCTVTYDDMASSSSSQVG
jgi:prealbumin domain-containing protein